MKTIKNMKKIQICVMTLAMIAAINANASTPCNMTDPDGIKQIWNCYNTEANCHFTWTCGPLTLPGGTTIQQCFWLGDC